MKFTLTTSLQPKSHKLMEWVNQRLTEWARVPNPKPPNDHPNMIFAFSDGILWLCIKTTLEFGNLVFDFTKDLSRLLQVGDKGLANGFSRYNS